MHAARLMARSGASSEEIFANLSELFPDQPSGRMENFARWERESQDRLDVMAELNWGTIFNLPDRLGCPPGTTGFRINVSVTGPDPETGQVRTRNESVTVEGARTINQLLTSAISQVVEKAATSGSPLEGPDRITREYVANNTQFQYVDCY